jgi:hypothetical protein
MQELLVTLIVLACTGYAVWALLPLAWRRAVAQRLAQGSWPSALQRAFAQMGDAGGCGGGCKGCAPKEAPRSAHAGEQPIRFHPRPPSP